MTEFWRERKNVRDMERDREREECERVWEREKKGRDMEREGRERTKESLGERAFGRERVGGGIL